MRLLVAIITACCVIVSCTDGSVSAAHDSRLRFYFDDYAFGEGETTLLKEAIEQSGHLSTVAGVTRAKFFVPKGYQQTHKWDVYWTSSAGCLAAYRRKLHPQQLVNCLPGTASVTDKGKVFGTLRAAYGRELAAAIAPMTYALPAEYFDLARALQGADPHQPWVLKEEVHQGKGVHIMQPGAPLLRSALQRSKRNTPKFSLAQRLVSDQLLVRGRPFYIRVWVLALGSDPVRAYLFDGGVVVFGTERRQQQHGGAGGATWKGDSQGPGQPSGDDLIVNLWKQDRAAADPWSVHQLRQHLDAVAAEQAGSGSGSGGFDDVWHQMQLAVAATVAAAVPGMRRAGASSRLPGYHGASSGFAVFGADFVVDAQLKPWLIEMNALPSLARKVISSNGGEGEGGRTNPFDQQKQRFTRSLLQVMLARHAVYAQQQEEEGPCSSSEGGGQGAAPVCEAGPGEEVLALGAAASEARAAAANGFVVLTPLVYQALGCMAGGANQTCAALQDLRASFRDAVRQQCSATYPAEGKGLVRAARSWLGSLAQLLPQFSWGLAAPHSTVAGRSTFQHSQLDRSFAALSAS